MPTCKHCGQPIMRDAASATQHWLHALTGDPFCYAFEDTRRRWSRAWPSIDDHAAVDPGNPGVLNCAVCLQPARSDGRGHTVHARVV